MTSTDSKLKTLYYRTVSIAFYYFLCWMQVFVHLFVLWGLKGKNGKDLLPKDFTSTVKWFDFILNVASFPGSFCAYSLAEFLGDNVLGIPLLFVLNSAPLVNTFFYISMASINNYSSWQAVITLLLSAIIPCGVVMLMCTIRDDPPKPNPEPESESQPEQSETENTSKRSESDIIDIC